MPASTAYFTKQNVAEIYGELAEVVNEWAKERGLNVVEQKSFRFFTNKAKFSFELTTDTDEDRESRAKLDIAAYEHWHGLSVEVLGKEFVDRGERFRVTGFVARRRKFPFTAVRVRDNTPYKFPISLIKAHFPELVVKK